MLDEAICYYYLLLIIIWYGINRLVEIIWPPIGAGIMHYVLYRQILMVASQAKLVKMKPQVNEVLDDSSLIKRLQCGLAETRKLVQGKEHQQHMQHLQQAAQNAAREAEIKLCRLRACFLGGRFLPNTLDDKVKGRPQRILHQK